ncbi:MAG: PhoH family protein, partial [Inhella sp.]
MILHHRFENASNSQLAHVCGELDAHLRGLAQACGVKLTRRHDEFRIEGPAIGARKALGVLQQLCLAADAPIADEQLQLLLAQAGATAAADAAESPAVQLHTRRKDLAARTPNQQRYLERILSHDLSFGVGPAGTGKTYLAVACAVDALERHQVQRIVLTRPAVEAGERLGFLPGDLAQKVDPYLRPLFDALFDLM